MTKKERPKLNEVSKYLNKEDLTFYLKYCAAFALVSFLILCTDSQAAQNLREAAEDLKNQVDGVAPLLGGVGVGIGCLLMMVGLGGLGRMIAATGATGFVLFTLWPSLQSLIERVFHR